MKIGIGICKQNGKRVWETERVFLYGSCLELRSITAILLCPEYSKKECGMPYMRERLYLITGFVELFYTNRKCIHKNVMKESIRQTFKLPLPAIIDSLLEIQVGGYYLDLHNDYDCCHMRYSATDQELYLSFRRKKYEENTKHVYVDLLFIDAMLVSSSLILDAPSLDDFKTIDTLYRGRFEVDNKLREFDDLNRALYYIGFYEGVELEVFASGLSVNV